MKKYDPKPQTPDESETSRRRFLKAGAAQPVETPKEAENEHQNNFSAIHKRDYLYIRHSAEFDGPGRLVVASV